jgi:hypothetical protein
MAEQLHCTKCGMKLGRGSTFCINCGHRIGDPVPDEAAPSSEAPPASTEDGALSELPETTLGEPSLPEVDELGLEELPEPETPEPPESSGEDALPPVEELSWEDEMPEPSEPKSEPDTPAPTELEAVPKAVDVEDLSWEEGATEIKEGMPFKEVEPPRVVTEDIDMTDAVEHLFPSSGDDATREAVAHLFPEGRGTTSSSFIDVVVGKPNRISAAPVKELDTPACPSCGAAITGDSFEYPGYVFEAMGKARMERGDELLSEDEHERAIESYEVAKLLFERAGNEKGVAEATKKIDIGYDAMARFHFDQGETHLKEGQFEWAIVQFKKARELYMFSTDAKKRAKCSEKSREAYEEWGKALESEGDDMVKAGNSREALMKYQEAAAKYREGKATKRLRGLDKKIRKA